MSFVSVRDILYDAYRNGYIVPAFNFDNYDLLEGILLGATRTKLPIIIQITQAAVQYLGMNQVFSYIRYKSKFINSPIAFHIDHANDCNFVEKCISQGVNSIMFDMSEYSVEKNIFETKKMINKFSGKQVFFESEVGIVGNCKQDKEFVYTDLEDVKQFVTECNVGSLGISIGNIHGKFEKNVYLDTKILLDISKIVNVPLVLHGCSGVVSQELKNIKASKVCKINFETELRVTYKNVIERYLKENPIEIKPRCLSKQIHEAVANVVEEKCKLVGK